MRRTTLTSAVLLVSTAVLAVGTAPARLAAQARCDCSRTAITRAEETAGDRDRSWPWWLLPIGAAFGGGAMAVPLELGDGELVDTGLPERAPAALATSGGAPASVLASRAPLGAGTTGPAVPIPTIAPLTTVTAAARSCVPVAEAKPARRSRDAVAREKAWWGALTPAQRAAVIRRNKVKAAEAEQRRKACVVLLPTGAMSYAGLGLTTAVRRRRRRPGGEA